MAFVGGGIVLLGKDKESLKPVLKGADGGGEFADAKSHVVWAKMTDKGQNVDFMLKEAGDNIDLKVVTSLPGPQGDALKKDPAGTIKGLEAMAGEFSKKFETGPFKAAVPAVKNAKFAAEGDRLAVTTSLPKAAIGELVKTVSEAKPEDLMKAL
jgi:hypothetical protein